MDEAARMNVLDARDLGKQMRNDGSTPTHELISQKDYLEGKLPVAEVERVLPRGAARPMVTSGN
jgi:hypothetical protein